MFANAGSVNLREDSISGADLQLPKLVEPAGFRAVPTASQILNAGRHGCRRKGELQ